MEISWGAAEGELREETRREDGRSIIRVTACVSIEYLVK